MAMSSDGKDGIDKQPNDRNNRFMNPYAGFLSNYQPKLQPMTDEEQDWMALRPTYRRVALGVGVVAAIATWRGAKWKQYSNTQI